MKLNFGLFKAYYQRIIPYVTALNFLMLFYNFQYLNDWMPWYGWMIVFFVVIYGVHWFDKRHVWYGEVTETAKRNGILMENNRLLKQLVGDKK